MTIWVFRKTGGKLGIPYLAQMSLIKCYGMLQIAKFTVFTNFELLRENQQRGLEKEVKLHEENRKRFCGSFKSKISPALR